MTMTLKKLFLAAVAVVLNTAIVRAEPKIVAITSIIEHTALNAVKDGAVEELARQGFKDGENIQILYENAQGQPSIAGQISRQFIGKNPAVIIAISTPSAQSVLSVTKKIPVVFSAVTDPVGAKLVKSNDAGNGNVTGVSDKMPVEEQLKLIKEIVPSATKIGVIYNPGETNSVSSVQELKEVAATMGFEVIDAPAMKTADVQSAARSLIGKADVMYAPTDNTVMATIESVTMVGQSAKIPFFTADTNSVSRGAVASIGFSYYQLGIETGKLAARILKGEDPNKMPVVYSKTFDLFVNKSAAVKYGITFSDEILERATEIIE